MRKFTILIILSCFLNINAQQFAWAKASNGAKKWDRSYSVCTDNNDNVYVTGTFQDSTITFDSVTIKSAGVQDIFIVKYSSQGNVIWAKSIGGIGADFVNCITTDANGNIYTGGFTANDGFIFASSFVNAKSFFVLKFNSTGNQLWAKAGVSNSYSSTRALTCGQNGDVFVTGSFNSSLTIDSLTFQSNGAGNIFVLRLSANGNLLWSHEIGGNRYDYVNDIQIDVLGNLILTGMYESSYFIFGEDTLKNLPAGIYGDYNLFIVKYNQNGDPLWAKQGDDKFAGSDEMGQAVVTDKDGNIFISGYFERFKFIYDNQVTIGDYSNSNTFLMKLDPNGLLQWINYKKYGIGAGANGLKIDDAGNLYLAGLFVDQDFLFNNIKLHSKGQYDIFLHVLNPMGQLLYGISLGSTKGEEAPHLALTKTNEVYLAGSFAGKSIALGTTLLLNTDTSAQTPDMFITKISFSQLVAVNEQPDLTNYKTLYPNPTSGKFTVNENISAIYDVLGNTVSFKTNSISTEINLSDKPKGIYFVEIKKGDSKIVKKVILE